MAEAPAVPWTLGLAVRGTGTWLSSSLHQPIGCQTVAQTLKAQVSRRPASSSGHCWSSQEQRNMAWALCSLHVFHCKLFSSGQRTGKLLVTTGAIINHKLGQGQSDTEGRHPRKHHGGLGLHGPCTCRFDQTRLKIPAMVSGYSLVVSVCLVGLWPCTQWPALLNTDQ